jgi:hypothetical protein
VAKSNDRIEENMSRIASWSYSLPSKSQLMSRRLMTRSDETKTEKDKLLTALRIVANLVKYDFSRMLASFSNLNSSLYHL